ncbi:MAG: elongation factor Ts [Parcubacteria group bacterium RIFCSPLOWO2_01_FULL_48_18]|nr:MAG: elongation factor Ts [Parcubacteria group bacterium RIFCSPLOWO2_01_FULL_48_18]
MNVELLKQLRSDTSASISDCRTAILESKGDYAKAIEIIRSKGLDRAAKKHERATGSGLIEAYVHAGGKIGVLIELRCETDFVARNNLFKELAHALAMQVAAMDPERIDTLMNQPYIKDQSLTVQELVKSYIGTLGENIRLANFVRYEI